MIEKSFNEVPNDNRLKKNTEGIKIFVSNRIDIRSKAISNRLYIPIRCGAYYDKDINSNVLGDDTGENISKKRIGFCEYTVLYWAWKNVKAKYYGLCHYRRFLSFSEIDYPEWNEQRFFYEDSISEESLKKHNLLNEKLIRKEILKYDILTSITYEVSNVPLVTRAATVQELFINHPSILTSQECLDEAAKIIKKYHSEYYDSFLEELSSKKHRGFNCFVMKKEYLDMFCTFLFDVLFKLESMVHNGDIIQVNEREFGYVGEILYGTFIRWAYLQGNIIIGEKHIVLFGNTEAGRSFPSIHKNKFYYTVRDFLRTILPAYKVSLRLDEKITTQDGLIRTQMIAIDKLQKQLDVMQKELEDMSTRDMCTFWARTSEWKAVSDSEKLAFWSDFPKATGDLRIIQNANALLLKKLRKICDELDIKFWLHGGTLVGALRHSGFVPWDDDIDVAMMRKDFDLLLQYLERNDTYTVLFYYYIGIGARSYRFKNTKIRSDNFIDIFVYDEYDLENKTLLECWRGLTQKKGNLTYLGNEACRNLGLYPSDPLLINEPELRRKLDKLFQSYINFTQSKHDSVYIVWGMDNNYENKDAYAWNHGRIFSKKDIYPLVECDFEGQRMYIPCDYEKYCIAEYGIRYIELHKSMGNSIHINEFYSGVDSIECAKQLIAFEETSDI